MRTLYAVKDFINFEHLKLYKELRKTDAKTDITRSDVMKIRPEARALYTVIAKSIILNFDKFNFGHKCQLIFELSVKRMIRSWFI